MKKAAVALPLMLIALALLLAACGGGSGTTASEETSGGTATESEAGGEAQTEEAEPEAEGGIAGAGAVAIEANSEGQLAFEEKEVTAAKPGKVTIDFTNQASLPHDVAIEDSAGKTIAQTEIISEGSDSTTAELKPGTYTFYCTVPGHRQAGMEGKLVVK